jgi:hypothetical protein
MHAATRTHFTPVSPHVVAACEAGPRHLSQQAPALLQALVKSELCFVLATAARLACPYQLLSLPGSAAMHALRP